MSRPGPNANSRVVKGLPPSWIGLARISTPWEIRNPSSPGSAKEGIVVVNAVTGFGGGGSLLGAAPLSPEGEGSLLGAAALSPGGE